MDSVASWFILNLLTIFVAIWGFLKAKDEKKTRNSENDDIFFGR